MPNLSVIDPGFYTTIQDAGRFGYRSLGVPISGPVDFESFEIAKKLVGNYGNQALLECTLKGPKLLFGGTTWVAVSGAPMVISLNDQKMQMNQAFKCRLGDLLHLENCVAGMRTYIAFAGGLQSPIYMKSRSYFSPVSPQSKINKADVLSFDEAFEDPVKTRRRKYPFLDFSKSQIEVSPGPEWDLLSKEEQNTILKATFEVGSNDRMGYRLHGKTPKTSYQIDSTTILPGFIQLTPDGVLLVAMMDAQITGGYPRILILHPEAQCLLAQKRSGDQLRLKIM